MFIVTDLVSLRNTIRVSNSFDPDQVLHFVWSDPCPNCLQRLSVEDTSKEKVKYLWLFILGRRQSKTL